MGEILERKEESLMEIENLSPTTTASDVLTEIDENPNNKFAVKYKLIAVGNSSVETEIISRPQRVSETLFEIEARASRNIEHETEIDIKYRGNSCILTEIQPIGYNTVLTEIEVPPHNRMYALYEVQQPPIITEVFNPTQDAFTREESAFETINYGYNASMVAGISDTDIWRSFIQFDLSTINPSYVLVGTKLRLYYKDVAPTNLKLELLNADSEWKEYNITNLNKPNPIKLISNEFSTNIKKGYIEFDVNEIAKDWISLKTINNGFVLRVANETQLGKATFHTRESMLPPELFVSYYDSRIFSQGRSQIITEMFVYNRGNSDKNTEVTVDSVFRFEKKDTELYVHRYDTPVPNDILTEITSVKPYIPSEITVSILKSLEEKVEISVWDYRNNPIETEITANRDFILVSIDSILRGSSEIATEITANKRHIHTEISVPEYDYKEIDVEISINSVWFSTKNTEITVSKENISTEITPRVGKNKDLYTTIAPSRDRVQAEIEIKHRSYIYIEIEPNIKSDVATEITANKPFIYAEISVNGYESNECETEINIKAVKQVDTEIFVKYTSVIETEICAKSVKQVDTEIISSKPYVLTEIVIPTWVGHDIETTIEPRVLMVNNMFTVIQVGSKGGAYAFII